jgi:hypothetical protein
MKNFRHALLLATLLLGGCHMPAPTPKTPVPPPVAYYNTDYHFTFTLPENWRGYYVSLQQWSGETYAPTTGIGMALVQGPEIILRSPEWTEASPTQDIPILVLTRRQWADDQEGRFSIFDGGVLFEISHNYQYVFVIWSRYNANESVKGIKEADDIVQSNQAANPAPIYPDQRN